MAVSSTELVIHLHLNKLNITRNTSPDGPYLESLKNGDIHVVAFAEDGLSNFSACLQFAFDYPLDRVRNLCKRINEADETGTIFPDGKLTALPKRFFRQPLTNLFRFQECLRDAFVANRDYCKSSKMLFDFTCAVKNTESLERELRRIAEEEDWSPLQEIEILFDAPRGIKVCPKPASWSRVFWELKEFAENHSGIPFPPKPLILAGWAYTNDVDKKARWEATIEWANSYQCCEILESLHESDYYYANQLTDYEVGPLGGPMHQEWDYEEKDRPASRDAESMLTRLKNEWHSLAGDIAHMTEPKAFSGAKLRRLIVVVNAAGEPPWGRWDYIDPDEKCRASFKSLRRSINAVISPHAVDHIDFEKSSGP